jgi:predicted PurR-regulated permease PerM
VGAVMAWQGKKHKEMKMGFRLSVAARFLLYTAAFIVVVAGMKAAASLLVPFLLSIFIALICVPPVAWLKGRGLPGWAAIAVMVFAIITAAALMGTLVGSSIRDFRTDLPFYETRLLEMTAGLQQWLAGHGMVFDIGDWRDSVNPGAVMQLAGNTLASLGGVTTNGFMILITVVFILAEQVGFREKLAQARNVPRDSLAAIGRFTDSVNRYVGLKTLTSLLTGVLVGLTLWLLGVGYPLMWGLLTFLLNFVPTIGSFLAAAPPVLLALVQAGPVTAGLAAGVQIIINLVIGNVLEPRWMGRGLNLSPLVVFLSLVFWGWVLGPIGMLLSVPLTILVKIALESDPGTRWIGVMLGQGVALVPVTQEVAATGPESQPPENTPDAGQ